MVDRRTFLKWLGASGVLLAMKPEKLLAAPLRPLAYVGEESHTHSIQSLPGISPRDLLKAMERESYTEFDKTGAKVYRIKESK